MILNVPTQEQVNDLNGQLSNKLSDGTGYEQIASNLRTTVINTETTIFDQVIDADRPSFVVLRARIITGVVYFAFFIDGLHLTTIQSTTDNNLIVQPLSVLVPKNKKLKITMYQSINNTSNKIDSISAMIL